MWWNLVRRMVIGKTFADRICVWKQHKWRTNVKKYPCIGRVTFLRDGVEMVTETMAVCKRCGIPFVVTHAVAGE